MTDKPTPKEIDLLVRTYLGDCGPQANRVYSFVTAVLAKWGQPAQAAEPADTVVLTTAQESLGVEFEKVLHDNLFDLYEESPHTARLDKTTTSARKASADSYHKHSNKGRNMTDIDAALAAPKHPKKDFSEVDSLLSWFNENDGFSQGTKAPHKWVLQTHAELIRLRAALAAQAGPSEAVAYLDIGAGGYLDLGTDLGAEALSCLPKGRHALVIAGTYGIDGYTAASTPQAAPAGVLEEAIAQAVAAEREACAQLAAQTVCDLHIPTGVKIYGSRAAKAIRARGTDAAKPAAPAQPRDDAVFVVWWSDHMPDATEADAWAEWCALRSNQPTAQAQQGDTV